MATDKDWEKWAETAARNLELGIDPAPTIEGECAKCGEPFARTIGCAVDRLALDDGISYERVAYNGETGERCNCCGVAIGGYHHFQAGGYPCKLDTCPKCGLNAGMCHAAGDCDWPAELFPDKGDD